MAVEQALFESSHDPPGVFGGLPPGLAAGGGQAGLLLDERQGMSASSELSEQDRLSQTEKLLDEHQQAVYRYAYRLCGCSATAEDLTQEVFLRAFRSMHQLRDEAAARGWLLVITRNEFARLCRKSAASGLDLDPQICETLGEVADPVVERAEWVEQALQQLPSEFRSVLLMFYFEDLSYAQIAEQLKIPLGTVMSRLNRGRSHMKAALDKAED